jgi:hypothetical protein
VCECVCVCVSARVPAHLLVYALTHTHPQHKHVDALGAWAFARTHACSGGTDGSGAACRPNHTQRCPECGETVSLGKLRRLEARVLAGTEANPHVLAFAATPALDALLKDATYHRAVTGAKLRKEVTETWAVITAVDAVLRGAGLEGQGGNAVFVDLCCGKSLTASLLALVHPGCMVVAVDKVTEAVVPHFRLPSKYVVPFKFVFILDLSTMTAHRTDHLDQPC